MFSVIYGSFENSSSVFKRPNSNYNLLLVRKNKYSVPCPDGIGIVIFGVALFPNEASTTRRSIPSPLAFIGRIVYGPFYT